jgi:NO-binding membrane sensor protein with MHYT domain
MLPRAYHLGAATSFGVVGIWAMQNLGNHAIRMLDGQPQFQTRYNAWVELATLFLSMASMIVAMYYTTRSERFPDMEILMATLIIIVVAFATHFISQKTILNYEMSYSAGYVLASLICRGFTTSTAFATFFYFKIKWRSSFIRRSACALLLAASIWGPHWIFEHGSNYEFKPAARRSTYSLSRQAEIVVIIALVGHWTLRPMT